MQALIYYDQRNIQLKDVEIPVPKNDEVLMRVTDAGLCQTQVNEFIEGPYIIKKTPIIVGHEFGGIIEKVGNINEDSCILGRQAAVLPLLKFDQYNNAAYYGLNGKNGGFAEYACIKKENIFYVQDKSLLTFIEPLLVAIHAGCKIKDFIKNNKICILGAGCIGICVAAVFRDFFGGNVVVNDILPNRLKRAEKAGFEVKEKRKLKAEYDIVVDCAGSDPTSKHSAFTESFNYLKKDRILLDLGIYFHPISMVPSAVLLRECNIITSYLYSFEDVFLLRDVINSLKIDFSVFIKKIRLQNIIEDGYYCSEVDKDSFTRLVVVP